MRNIGRYNYFPQIPYGSDAVLMPYSEGQPWLPVGLNSSYISGEDFNGYGLNWPRFVTLWTDSELSEPSIMGNDNPGSGLPDEFGQTVDVRIAREKRIIKIPRDYNRMRAPGHRGHVDED